MVKDFVISLIKQVNILTCFYGQTFEDAPEMNINPHEKTINQYFFFTHFSLFLTTITLILGCMKNKYSEKIFLFLLPNVFVYEFLLSMIYWSLVFVKRELIVSKLRMKPENYLLLPDLSQHAFPLIGLSIGLYEKYFKVDRKNFILNFFVLLTYTLMVIYNNKVKNVFPYAFLDKMGTVGVFAVFLPIFFVLSCVGLYAIMKIKNRSKKNQRTNNTEDLIL